MKKHAKKALSHSISLKGKSIPTMLVLGLFLVGGTSAALISNFGTITGEAEVTTTGINLQGSGSDNTRTYDFNDQGNDILGNTYRQVETLQNLGESDYEVSLSTTCNRSVDDTTYSTEGPTSSMDIDWSGTNACEGVETRFVEYYDDAGASGADFSGYEAPDQCDSTVSYSSAAENALDSGDEVVCVEGTLSDPLEIDEDEVTVASTQGPQSTAIDLDGSAGPAVTITGDDVTFKGFEVTGVNSGGNAVRVTPDSGSSTWLSGVEVSYLNIHDNEVKGLMLTGGVEDSKVSNVVAHHNTNLLGDDEGPSDSQSDGVGLWRVNDTVVEHVTAYMNGDNGVYFNGESNTGEDLVAHDNGDQGIDVSADYGMTGGTELVDVESYSNQAPGIEVEDNEKKVTIKRASLYENPKGLLVADNEDSSTVEADDDRVIIKHSNILDSNDVGVENNGGAKVVANNNWWGTEGISTSGDKAVASSYETKQNPVQLEADSDDKFGAFNSFAVNLAPGNYSVTTEVAN